MLNFGQNVSWKLIGNLLEIIPADLLDTLIQTLQQCWYSQLLHT